MSNGITCKYCDAAFEEARGPYARFTCGVTKDLRGDGWSPQTHECKDNLIESLTGTAKRLRVFASAVCTWSRTTHPDIRVDVVTQLALLGFHVDEIETRGITEP